jgi:hypothetical protein
MAQQKQSEKPRIFISHAWEDKALVRQLEAELRTAGAEVWVDHIGIRGGDNLPERISEALEWCNTLLLIWSEAASKSRWVKLEWTNAVSLEKAIIPCRLQATQLPGILAHKAYIDFQNVDRGIGELFRALNLAGSVTTPAMSAEKLAQVLQNQLTVSSPPTKPKPPQILLRSQPLDQLSIDEVQKMLREKDFFDRSWNNSGRGLRHEYEAIERQGEKSVIDHTTGLTWQQSGSPAITYTNAEKYIRDLNDKRFAGYNDWRLPTLEEAMSLMEPKTHGNLYIDPVFNHNQTWIWTADKESAGRAWHVHFLDGTCDHDGLGDDAYVRAVRS